MLIHLVDLSRARTAHSAAEKELRETKASLSGNKDTLAKDFGRDWEWKKLDGTCVEKDLGS